MQHSLLRLLSSCFFYYEDATNEDFKLKNHLQGKNGCTLSFKKRLEEHTASTTTLSGSLVWVIGNIILGKEVNNLDLSATFRVFLSFSNY